MKEFETKAQLTGLTSQSNPFTLDVRGPRFNRGEYIFMGEQGEASREAHKNSAFPKTRTERESRLGEQRDIEISPQRIELAREKWSEHYKWKGENIEELPFDERQSVEAAIRTGVAPMPGGAEELFITDYNADARLQDMVTVINREIINTGGNPEPRFLQHYINELSELRRAGTFATDEARQQAVNLETRLNSWINEAVQTQDRRDYSNLNREELTEVINSAPAVEASHFPEQLLEAAMRFKETREMLINRILFKSFEDETETNSYEINLYAQSNLDTLLGYLSREERNQYDYYVSLRTAAQLFHTMNSTIIGGNLEEFIRIAERINYQHFVLMQRIKGVPEVMRLYEQKYQDYLARHGRITTEGYIELKREVEESFKGMNDVGLVRSEYETGRDSDESWRMQDWELRRALNVGRTFYNITFRAAEQIASGKISRGEKKDRHGHIIQEASEEEQQFSSFPQESAVRIMNWVQHMLQRFQVAEVRGGLEFLNRVRENYSEFLEAKGRKLGKNKVIEFGGMNVKELEAGGMFGVSGIYSSWRIENMAFTTIKLKEGDENITIREWLRRHRDKIKAIRNGGEEYKNMSMRQRQEELANEISPLIDNMDLALGVLLKQIFATDEVGYKVRQKIWEKITIGHNTDDVRQGNLPLIIDYLTALKLEDGTAIKDLRSIVHDELGVSLEDERWQFLRNKLLLQHEKNIKQAVNKDSASDIPDQEFDADEENLIRAIKREGIKLAPHLADIVFPYTPFMNDVPFELLDYGKPGEEFYKRRSGGDLPSYNRAQAAFIQIMNNPGGLGVEETLKQFDAIVKGIESPQGTADAQERIFPMFSAWGEFIIAKPGQRQIILKSITEFLRRPTSIAQEYAGMEADSLDEHQMRKILEDAVKIGVLNLELYEDMKKKKNLTLIWLLWALFRDYFYLPVVYGGWEFAKSTAKGST